MAFGITLNLGLSTSGPLNVPLEIISAIIDTTQIPNPVTIIATGSGTVNWMVDSTASYASIADAEADLGSADSSGSFLSSDTGATVDNTGVSPDGSYFIHFWGDEGSVISQAYEVDNTAPVLTSQSASVVSGSIEVDVTSDTDAGTLYAAVRLASDAVLTRDDIQSGTGNAVANQSEASPIAGLNEFTFAGLSPDTYVVDLYQNDGLGNDSAVVSTTSVAVTATASFVSATEVINSSASSATYTGSSIGAATGSNRLRALVVQMCLDGPVTSVSATIGGTSLTLLSDGFANNLDGYAVFYHRDTSLPSGVVEVSSLGAALRACLATVVDFENIEQATTFGTPVEAQIFGGTATVSRTTTAANSILFSCASWRANGSTALPILETQGGTVRYSAETGTASSNDVAGAIATEDVPSIATETHIFDKTGADNHYWRFGVELLSA